MAPSSSVRADPETSADFLIVEVVTLDRIALLYDLARELHELGLIIHSARIATSGNQVVDVFYVTERDGSKPTDAGRHEAITRSLMAVIETAD